MNVAQAKGAGLVSLSLVIAAALLTCGCEVTGSGKAKYEVRTWRIIVNDDGEIPIPGPDRTLEQFLVPKFNDVLGTQVDAFFLCLGSTDRHVAPAAARVQDTMNQWADDGTVPEHLDTQIRTVIGACRKAGVDVFLAVRMNDIHDAWAPKLSYPLKVRRPDLLIGKQRVLDAGTLMSAHWSGFDWSKADVRKHFHDFILWCCERYDFDGVELDWFRHPLLFKLGEERQNIENMNQFVRDVHTGLDRIAAERGKPYHLTVRPMDTPELSLRTGLDVQQWLKEGLLDMLMIGGGYMPYGARLKEFIDLAHRYGVPAYPSQNHFKEPEMMRTVASNFFALGADGFYLFNWYGVEDGSEKAKCLDQCGAPETLAGLDKRYLADTGARISYLGHCNPPSQFPSLLVGGKAIELVVGDDLAAARRDGTLGRLTLEIAVSNVDSLPSLADRVNRAPSQETIALEINSVRVPDDAIQRIDEKTFVASVQAPPLDRGVNHVRVFPGPRCKGSLKASVDAMELVVDYLPLDKAGAKKPHVGPQGPLPGQRIIKALSGVPLSLYQVPVGSKKEIVFQLDVDLKNVKKARLALNAEDFDSPEELTISVNGADPLAIPDALIADTGFRTGFINVPLDQLRAGKNNVLFTFTSNLGGTTAGFDVLEALLILE